MAVAVETGVAGAGPGADGARSVGAERLLRGVVEAGAAGAGREQQG